MTCGLNTEAASIPSIFSEEGSDTCDFLRHTRQLVAIDVDGFSYESSPGSIEDKLLLSNDTTLIQRYHLWMHVSPTKGSRHTYDLRSRS